MNISLRARLFFAASLLFMGNGFAQVTGIQTIPGNYASLSAAVADLNANGVGAGGATIKLTANQTTTAALSLGSATLRASLSAANPLTFDGDGFTVTAGFAGTLAGSTTAVTGNMDAVFFNNGVDFVNYQGFTFNEQASNTTNITQIEAGLAFLNVTTTSGTADGCQNISVTGNTFAFNKVATNPGHFSIYIAPYTQGGTTSAIWSSTFGSDQHAFFNITGNTFTGGTSYVVYRGAATGAAGRRLKMNSNTLTNIGGSASTNYGLYTLYLDSLEFNTNTITMSAAHTTTLYGLFASTGTGGFFQANGNDVTLNNGGTTSTTNGLNSATFVGGNREMNNNTIRFGSFPNITSGAIGGILGAYSGGNGLITLECSNNSCTNQTVPATTGTVTVFQNGATAGAAATLSRRVVMGNNTVQNITRTNSGTFYGLSVGTADTIIVNNNLIDNIAVTNNSTSGSSTVYGIYSAASPQNSRIFNNTISNISIAGSSTSTSGTLAGILNSPVATNNIVNRISNNTIANLAFGVGTTTGAVTGITVNTATQEVDANIIRNLTANQAGTVNGITASSGPANTISNNFISTLSAPAATSLLAVNGINISGGTNANVFFNTIYPSSGGALSGGATFGAAGISVGTSVIASIRNNIVNITGTATTGYIAALRRSAAGTAGTKPTNISASNNIYNAPYIYGEGTTLSTATNVYYVTGGTTGTVDPAFNTSCGLYKTFMGESGTFSEDNLSAGTTTGTFAPAGTSFAESNAVSTLPAITTDFAGTARSAPADAGALEFAGTAVDATAPLVTYTPATTFPNTTATCSFTVSIPITDNNGVNTTTSKPRLYFRKSTAAVGQDLNQLAATNTSADNGFKYVETTSTNSPFAFTIDYSLLQSAPAAGDVISYFVVAQDLATTPNVRAASATFASGFCPTDVALGTAAFPTTGANSYTIQALPTAATVSASPVSICISGTTTLTATFNASSTGLQLQWQSSPAGAGTFTDVAGATTNPYTTATLTTATDYQLVAKSCAGNTVLTSGMVAITVNNPMVTATTPGSRCGVGTVTLGATGSAGTTLSWFAAGANTPLPSSGNSFITPSIGATTNFEVTAAQIGSADLTGRVTTTAPGSATSLTTYTQVFSITETTRLNSVTVFSSTGTAITVSLLNSGGTAILLTTGSVTTAMNDSTNVPLGWTLTPGTYRLGATGMTGNFFRENSGAVYPTPLTAGGSSVGSVAGFSSSLTGAVTTSASWYFLYNWNMSKFCESPRTVVTATVTPAPAINLTATPATICAGQSTTLNTTSANADYTYTYTPGNLTGAMQTVMPTANTTYTVTATDASGGANNGCVDTASIAIAVNLAPAAITVTPAAGSLACGGTPVQIDAAYNMPNFTFGTGTVSNGATAYPAPLNNYYGAAKSQILLRAPELTNMGITPGSAINAISFTVTAVGTAFSGSLDSFQVDMGLTPVSTLTTAFVGGLTTVRQPATLTFSTVSLPVIVSIPVTDFVWDGSSNIVVQTNFGNAAVTAVSSTRSVQTLQTTSQPAGSSSYFRANSTSAAGALAATTATVSTTRTNITLTMKPGAVFTNASGLFTDAAATTAYTSGGRPTIYAKPGTTAIYTATASIGSCSSTGTTAITVAPAANAPLANTTGAANSVVYTQSGTATVQNADCELMASVAASGTAPVSGNVKTDVYLQATVPTTAGGTPYVARSFQVTPQNNPATTTGDLVLYFTNAEFQAYNNTAPVQSGIFPALPDAAISTTANTGNVRVTKKSGSSATGGLGTYTPGVSTLITPATTWNAAGNSGNGQWEVSFPTTGFSGFFVSSASAAPLPVPFLNVTAKAEGSHNVIAWQMGTEPDGLHYEVERETRGAFATIGRLNGTAAGSYLLHDEAPLAGTSRYRIRAVEASGADFYSKVVSVSRATGSFQITAFPNPTDDGRITVRTQGAAGKGASVSVWNAMGQLVLQQQPVNGSELNLNLSELAAGVYTLRYTDSARTEAVQVTRR